MVCRGSGRNCATSPLSRAPDPLPAPGEAALATVPRAASDSTIAADSVPKSRAGRQALQHPADHDERKRACDREQHQREDLTGDRAEEHRSSSE